MPSALDQWAARSKATTVGARVNRPAILTNPYRRRLTMQWQTPKACDFRFGFEITMYVAAR